MNPAFWRRWHRWIAFPAALFLLFAAITGVITAMTEFFGEAEALREATRNMTSPVRTDSGAAAWQQPLALALARAATDAPGAPIDRIQIQFKGPQPTVDVFLGKPGGGEDRRLVLDARTDTYADKPRIPAAKRSATAVSSSRCCGARRSSSSPCPASSST